MRIRQMGFSSKIKAHKNILTLETLRFISEFIIDGNAQQAALRIGIPPTYASRYGQWLKKHPFVVRALERELDQTELRNLKKSMVRIENEMQICSDILGLSKD